MPISSTLHFLACSTGRNYLSPYYHSLHHDRLHFYNPLPTIRPHKWPQPVCFLTFPSPGVCSPGSHYQSPFFLASSLLTSLFCLLGPVSPFFPWILFGMLTWAEVIHAHQFMVFCYIGDMTTWGTVSWFMLPMLMMCNGPAFLGDVDAS